MKRIGGLTVVALVAIVWGPARAEDWPQWRGPQGDGVAPPGPVLADSWPADGPKKLWESEDVIIAQQLNGGFGGVSVAGGRAYLYAHWKSRPPIATRTVSADVLKRLGWWPGELPADLAGAMEQARLSEERAKLKPKELKPWLDKWVAEHLKDADTPKVRPLATYVRQRLSQGAGAIALDVLAKLVEIKDREFPDTDSLDKWLAGSSLAGDLKARVLRVVPTTGPETATDTFFCLDADTGKTIWKREFPNQAPFGNGVSTTVCIAGDRLLGAGGKVVYCLDVKDGSAVWQVPVAGGGISSSPVAVGGKMVILAGRLTAYRIADGTVAWTQPKLTGSNPSPVLWSSGGKTYLICNANAGLACVDPADGQILWKVPGGGSGSPVVNNDVAVLFGPNTNTGLVAYKITPEKAEKLWSLPYADRGTSAILFQGYMYSVGGLKDAKALCVAVSDGKPAWEQAKGFEKAEVNSPILADGKIIMFMGLTTHELVMFKASPEKFEALARAKVETSKPPSCNCTSPSIVDGRLFLRLNERVVCYDLRK